MSEPRLVICGDVRVPSDDPRRDGRKELILSTHGQNKNVYLRLEDVAKVFLEHLTPRLTDLVEIASYVYAADTAVVRGTGWSRSSGQEAWERDFHFIIPVRDKDFWCARDTSVLLSTILGFLSDDRFHFDFCGDMETDPRQEYLAFGGIDDWPFHGVDRVLMFSGGLDSLAGAAETAAAGRPLVLVSHRSVATLDKRQRDLFSALKSTYRVPMFHIPVWINKQAPKLGRESTQRTRSFLYSALGTSVAASVDADGTRFYENGIVSLNLPVADEALRARTSRTTHPWALKLFGDFYSQVLGRPFVVDNPYLFHTKAEVVSALVAAGGGPLIPYSCSCVRTFFQTKTQRHCGGCCQCIDRRIAILAAGAEAHDPQTDYVSDVFAGQRKDGYENSIAIDYARHALELSRATDLQLAERFGHEFARAGRAFPNDPAAAEGMIRIHQRHGQDVTRVLSEQIERHAGPMMSGELDPSCMLSLIAGRRHLLSVERRYAERVHHLLADGLPRMCEKGQPRDEPQLQAWCDGILCSFDDTLVREYPFVRWASALTKPDWSTQKSCLWVELKYVREHTQRSNLTEGIAADITKYEGQRRVLFVIYDPHHRITDEASFSLAVEEHEGMLVRFIR